MDALRPLRDVTRSVTGCIPTQSVGTIMVQVTPAFPVFFTCSLDNSGACGV